MNDKNLLPFISNLFEVILTKKECLVAWKQLITIIEKQIKSSFAIIGVINNQNNFDIIAISDKTCKKHHFSKKDIWLFFTDLILNRKWQKLIDNEKTNCKIINTPIEQTLNMQDSSITINNSIIMKFKTATNSLGMIIIGNKQNPFNKNDQILLQKASKSLQILLHRRDLEYQIYSLKNKSSKIQKDINTTCYFLTNELKNINKYLQKNTNTNEIKKKKLTSKLKNINNYLTNITDFYNILLQNQIDDSYLNINNIISNLSKAFKMKMVFLESNLNDDFFINEEKIKYIFKNILTFIKRFSVSKTFSIELKSDDLFYYINFSFFSNILKPAMIKKFLESKFTINKDILKRVNKDIELLFAKEVLQRLYGNIYFTKEKNNITIKISIKKKISEAFHCHVI